MILSYRQVDFQILKCFHMWKQVSFFNVLKVTNSYQTLFMSFSYGNQRWYAISLLTTVLNSPFLALNKMIKEVKCKYYFWNTGHTISLEGKELQKALQYLPTQGLPALVNWLKDLQKEVHHPPQETELIITCGSQDGLCKVLEMLLHPSGGTPVSTDLDTTG